MFQITSTIYLSFFYVIFYPLFLFIYLIKKIIYEITKTSNRNPEDNVKLKNSQIKNNIDHPMGNVEILTLF